MNIGKIILLIFTLLIGVLQAQDEQQKGVNEDDFPTLTMVTHLKVCFFIIRTKLNRCKTSSEIRDSCPPPCSREMFQNVSYFYGFTFLKHH